MKPISAQNPVVLNKEDLEPLISRIDVVGILKDMFKMLGEGKAVQPPQQLVVFPDGEGDFINYLGVIAERKVYGIKTSPYLVKDSGALVTAWTMLMSMETGAPILLTDSSQLTVERTAATTILAIDYLASQESKKLALIGTGNIGKAHLRYALTLRDWSEIVVYSPNIKKLSKEETLSFTSLDPRVKFATDLDKATDYADVIMLCTSSGKPILDPEQLKKQALITSISTNIFQAHEVPPHSLKNMNVYCDYKETTPHSAGEMVLAAKDFSWSKELIKGDLTDLVLKKSIIPDYSKHIFFRSIGLGLEDIAIALALYDIKNNSL